MNTHALGTVKSRWLPNYERRGGLLPVHQTFHRLLAACDELKGESAKLSNNAHLSESGRTEAARTFVATNTVPTLVRAKVAVERAEHRLADSRTALLPHASAPTEVSGAIRRSEIRGMLADLEPAKRIAILFDPAADNRLIEAVVEMPVVLSGLTGEQHSRLLESYVARTHPAESARLDEEAGALQVAKAAIRIAHDGIRDAVNMQPRAYDDWLAKASAGVKDESVDVEHAAAVVEGIAADAVKLPIAARASLVERLLQTNSDEIVGKVAA